MGKEEPFFVVIVLEGHGIGLNVSFTLSFEYTPILWVSIESIRKGNVFLDGRCGGGNSVSGGLYLQMIQDGIRAVKVYVQCLK